MERARGKIWGIKIEISETEDHTDAKAKLSAAGQTFAGWGRARRNPTDPDVPAIGDELACARALHELTAELVAEAARRIEEFEHRPVHLNN